MTVGLRGKAMATAVPSFNRQDDEGIILRVLDDQSVVAGLFEELGVLGNGQEIERRLWSPEARIDFAQRKKSF
jgi:hypothetical protein